MTLGPKAGPGLAKARCLGEAEAGRRFRDARNKLGLSQFTLAEQLGVSDTTVENWERGASRIPAWALVEVERRAA